jgi:hypothetical protein
MKMQSILVAMAAAWTLPAEAQVGAPEISIEAT